MNHPAADAKTLKAEVARREEELVSITGDLHKLIDGLEAEVTELRERLRLQEAGCSGWIGSLRADNARLRALAKAAEWKDAGACPWCRADRDARHGEHGDSCPAFTPEGEVR